MRILRALLLGLCLLFTASPTPTQAQDRPAARRAKRDKKAARPARPSKRRQARNKRAATPETVEAPVKKEPARKERPTDTAATRAAESVSSQGVDSEVVKEGDSSVKVMRFSGLDVEGRLKSPQLLYFVNRVRAEFERPKLPHRSFMPELDRSTQRDPL